MTDTANVALAPGLGAASVSQHIDEIRPTPERRRRNREDWPRRLRRREASTYLAEVHGLHEAPATLAELILLICEFPFIPDNEGDAPGQPSASRSVALSGILTSVNTALNHASTPTCLYRDDLGRREVEARRSRLNDSDWSRGAGDRAG